MRVEQGVNSMCFCKQLSCSPSQGHLCFHFSASTNTVAVNNPGR